MLKLIYVNIFNFTSIFLIVLSGWLLRKFKIVTDDWVHILNVFAYYVSLPALIVASFWEINFLSKESWNIIFLSLLTLGLFSLAVFILLHFIQINKNLKTAIFLTATVGNTIYMGFPLVELGFGKRIYFDRSLDWSDLFSHSDINFNFYYQVLA